MSRAHHNNARQHYQSRTEVRASRWCGNLGDHLHASPRKWTEFSMTIFTCTAYQPPTIKRHWGHRFVCATIWELVSSSCAYKKTHHILFFSGLHCIDIHSRLKTTNSLFSHHHHAPQMETIKNSIPLIINHMVNFLILTIATRSEISFSKFMHSHWSCGYFLELRFFSLIFASSLVFLNDFYYHYEHIAVKFKKRDAWK